jgi:alkylation response protein AidB-like acyl-CoA dehydrogenase
MRLGLLATHDELKNTVAQMLAGTVDGHGQRIAATPDSYRLPGGFLGLLETVWQSEEPLLRAGLIAEEAGRAFAPISPRTALLTGWLARDPRVDVAGTAGIAVSILGDGSADAMPTAVTGHGKAILEGECVLVEDPGDATELLTLARTETGSALFLLPLDQPGVERLERDRLDPTRPAFGLRIAPPAQARRVADASATAALLPDILALGRLLAAAEMLGIADLMLSLATGYSNRRTQFGVPIGSFQVIAHACADILCEVELLRSLVYAAAASPTASGAPDPAMAARAKGLASDTGPRIANRVLQIFGGEGLTWDRGVHFGLRRQQALRVAFGTAEQCWDDVSEVLT